MAHVLRGGVGGIQVDQHQREAVVVEYFSTGIVPGEPQDSDHHSIDSDSGTLGFG